MNVVCIGVSHHTAPVEIREKFAVADFSAAEFAREFRQSTGVAEVVVVSTCNRVEIYASGPDIRAATPALDSFFQSRFGADYPADLFYRHDAPESIGHLFEVVCGLDSMVVGETEILGQVKDAYAMACGAGLTSRTLNKIFQRAFHVAKAVRTKTRINRGATSVGSAAVELAGKIFGDLATCKVLLMGAGENSERTARNLMSRGVTDLIVTNRSLERAARLAAALGGRSVAIDAWQAEVHDIDILIASTASSEPVVTKAHLQPVISKRLERPLFCIDIAVPRDIADDVNELENVYLYDIDSLEAIARQSIEARRTERLLCGHIISEQVAAVRQWLVVAAPSGSASERVGSPTLRQKPVPE